SLPRTDPRRPRTTLARGRATDTTPGWLLYATHQLHFQNRHATISNLEVAYAWTQRPDSEESLAERKARARVARDQRLQRVRHLVWRRARRRLLAGRLFEGQNRPDESRPGSGEDAEALFGQDIRFLRRPHRAHAPFLLSLASVRRRFQRRLLQGTDDPRRFRARRSARRHAVDDHGIRLRSDTA